MTDSEKLDLLISEMQGMKSDMQDVKSDIQELNQRTTDLEKNVTEIKLTIENEISVNIRRVAEGHFDLSRNLHEALRMDSEKEMLAIRVNVLEGEVRRLKERLDSIA